MTKQQQAGWKLFQDLKCNNCHDGVLFTDQQYHNVGVGMDGDKAEDAGRFDKDQEGRRHWSLSKTPTLRDITKVCPVFPRRQHENVGRGSRLHAGGGKDNKYLDKKNPGEA
jgi:cytochrome c peroxidase